MLASAFAGSASLSLFRHARAEDGFTLPGRLYVCAGHGGRGAGLLRGIFAYRPEQSGWSQILDVVAAGARVSPDGRSIAYFTIEPVEGRREGIVWTQDLREVGEPVRVHGAGYSPLWAADGKHLISSIPPKPRPGSYETWKIPTDGGERTRLPIPETERVVDGSADGAWLLTVSARRPRGLPAGAADQRSPIHAIRTDGTGECPVVPGDETPDDRARAEGLLTSWPRISPDGRLVAYLQGRRDVPADLWLVGRDGSGRRQICVGDAGRMPTSLAWSPDGRWLAVGMLERPEKQTGRFPRGVEILDLDGKLVHSIDLIPVPESLFVLDWRREP